ncbi:MAG: hypothetical protein WDM76_12380 [Limisphaerales bacterium]
MSHKSRQKRHRRPTAKKQVWGLTILALVVALGVIGGILWLLNSPRFFSAH